MLPTVCKHMHFAPRPAAAAGAIGIDDGVGVLVLQHRASGVPLTHPS